MGSARVWFLEVVAVRSWCDIYPYGLRLDILRTAVGSGFGQNSNVYVTGENDRLWYPQTTVLLMPISRERPLAQPQRKQTKSAMCEFTNPLISRLQRMTGLTGRTAACRSVGEGPE